MSGELWFAEGFTNYYTGLILCRAGLESKKEYVEGLHYVIDYVVNSPGRNFFNPMEMSYQAPFADAATSIDPNYRSNTFISYYVYGQVLALALDLQLRNEKGDLSLDGFMKFAWNRFGKPELPYNVRDMQTALAAYASPSFADLFFDKFIFQSQLPDYEKLLGSVGITYSQGQPASHLGAIVEKVDSALVITNYSTVGGPAYSAGLERGDKILSIENQKFASAQDLTAFITKLTPGSRVKVSFLRFGTVRTADLIVAADPTKKTILFEDAGRTANKATVARREAWLKPR